MRSSLLYSVDLVPISLSGGSPSADPSGVDGMLTKNPSETASPEAPAATKPHAAAGAARVDELVCYFEGDYVPLKDARVNIMTHAFMYGTAVFEGIRGYWNAEQQTLFALRVRDHVERIRDNARMLLMEELPSVDELTGLIVE